MAADELDAPYAPSPVTRAWLLGCESVGVMPEPFRGVYLYYPGGRAHLVAPADVPRAVELLGALIADGLFAAGGSVRAFGTRTWFYDRVPRPARGART